MTVVLFERLGPYHLARLEAAGQRMTLTCLELLTHDKTYAWEVTEGAEHFRRVRLFGLGEEGASTLEVVRRVHAALDEANPQTVAVPGWAAPLALAALDWCASRRRPVVMMSESTVGDAPRHFLKEAIKRRLVGGFSAAGLVGGQPHAEYLKTLGVPAQRVFVGYDAVDNTHFATGADAARAQGETLRASLDLPARYFLASNRFVEKKNLPGLLTAYAGYRARVGERAWELVLLGDGPLRPQIERQRAELGLQSSLHLPGFKQYQDLPAYYALAGGFVHASLSEQWGLVVNEAMASGLPVLVSNRCGCAPDLVEEGRNGWTFDPTDLSALSAAMEKFSSLANESLNAMGQTSRALVAAWSPEAFAEGLSRAVDAASTVPVRTRFLDRSLLWTQLKLWT